MPEDRENSLHYTAFRSSIFDPPSSILSSPSFSGDATPPGRRSFAANVNGSIAYQDLNALTVGTVGSVVGVSTNNHDVTLSAGGSLTVLAPVDDSHLLEPGRRR